MKKIILTFSLLAGVLLTASAQVKFEVGLKGGANFANAKTDMLNSDGITSFHGGAFTLLKVASFGIQPEILYSSQGTEINGARDVNLDYINVPVMLKLYLPLGLNFQAGPQFGFLTDQLKDIDGNGTDDQLKNSDLSAVVGAGWDLPFGLKVDARYILGLSNINESQTVPDEFKNRMFQLSIGYSLFKLGN
ncbi:MAG: porin family protein [Bacteroidota bacterium]